MKIFKYFDFILENSKNIKFPFVYSNAFKDKISLIDSPISNDILLLLGEKMPYSLINIGKTNDTITFIPADRLNRSFNSFIDKLGVKSFISAFSKLSSNHENWNKGSIEIKIGRFIKKILGDKYNDSEIEKFVNMWKSLDDFDRFELWTGHRIKMGYDSTKYHYSETSINPLMNSCMNDMPVVEFYQYCNGLRLLALLDEEGYILGRALVWKDYKYRDIMDRVYYVYDKDYYKFINYANKNGWYYKKRNVSGGSTFVKDGEEQHLLTKVRVPDVFKFKNDGFPYMDTFYYAQGEWAQNYEPEGTYLKLQDADGGYEEYENDN